MNKNIFLLLSFFMVGLCLQPAVSHAVDGMITFGTFFDAQNVRLRPDGGQAEYQSEIKLGHRFAFLHGFLRPFVDLTTFMDGHNGDGSFHPGSIRYDVGLSWETKVNKRLFFLTSLRHYCWHPVDANTTVEQANYFEIGFRF